MGDWNDIRGIASFSLLHHNIRSLAPHFDELLGFVMESGVNFDVIVLTEVGLKLNDFSMQEMNYAIWDSAG